MIGVFALRRLLDPIEGMIAGIPVGIFALAGGFTPSTLALSYVLFIFVMQLLTSGLGEEPGWRGFLLPPSTSPLRGGKYIWILGLIWAIWRYPLVIIQTLSGMQGFPMPQMVITIIISSAGMTMSQIGITFISAWLYNQTRSVFLMIVFHAHSNVLSTWLLNFLAEPQAVTLFVALIPWAVVIFLQRRLGKEKFPGEAIA